MPSQLASEILKRRYLAAGRAVAKFHVCYAIICVLAFLVGVFMPEVRVMVPLALLCYLYLYQQMFKRWSIKSLIEKIDCAIEPITAEVFDVTSKFGFHQVAYQYTVKSRRYKAFDLLSAEQIESFRKGETAEVLYNPNSPSMSYLKIQSERDAKIGS